MATNREIASWSLSDGDETYQKTLETLGKALREAFGERTSGLLLFSSRQKDTFRRFSTWESPKELANKVINHAAPLLCAAWKILRHDVERGVVFSFVSGEYNVDFEVYAPPREGERAFVDGEWLVLPCDVGEDFVLQNEETATYRVTLYDEEGEYYHRYVCPESFSFRTWRSV